MPPGLKDHKFKLVTIDHEVEIYTGDDITLLCRLSPATSAVAMEIRWFKGTECIYLYRNGHVVEARSYDGRFNVNTKALQRGDVSLRLWESEEAYEDKYTCQVIHGEQREEKRVVLKYNGDTGVMYAETGKTTDRHRKRMEESVQNLVRRISPSSNNRSIGDRPKDDPVMGGESPGPVSPVSPVVSELRLVQLQGSSVRRAAGNTILGPEESGRWAEGMGSGSRQTFYSSETYQEAEKQLREKERRMQKEREVEERKLKERRDELDKNMHESLKKLEVEIQARAEAERNLMNITRQMEEKNREIEEKSREIKEKNRVIEEKNKEIERVLQQLGEMERSAGEKVMMNECDRQREKDREIERLKEMLEKKDREIERMRLKQRREDSVVQNGCLKQVTLKLSKDVDILRKVLGSFSDTQSLLREMCKNE